MNNPLINNLKLRMERESDERRAIREKHREQLRINTTGKLKAEPRDLPPEDGDGAPMIEINLEEFENSMELNRHPELEHQPRATVIKFVQTALDTEFSFKVPLNCGDNYVQAMRQVLSRTRKKARMKKKVLDDFKTQQKPIEHFPEADPPHDLVTLIRTKNLSKLEGSVYDVLFSAFDNINMHKEAK